MNEYSKYLDDLAKIFMQEIEKEENESNKNG